MLSGPGQPQKDKCCVTPWRGGAESSDSHREPVNVLNAPSCALKQLRAGPFLKCVSLQ